MFNIIFQSRGHSLYARPNHTIIVRNVNSHNFSKLKYNILLWKTTPKTQVFLSKYIAWSWWCNYMCFMSRNPENNENQSDKLYCLFRTTISTGCPAFLCILSCLKQHLKGESSLCIHGQSWQIRCCMLLLFRINLLLSICEQVVGVYIQFNAIIKSKVYCMKNIQMDPAKKGLELF